MELVEEVFLAYESDPLIDELGVILSNELPHIIILEHKIGLSMAILKPLFLYASTNLQPPLLESHTDDKFLEKLSLCALLVKGDFPPALVIRKKLLLKGFLQPLKELQFLQVVLSKHSKSPSCWHHRRWCIEFLKNQIDKFSFEQFWSNELQLCERMCDIYPRNYYSWNYRLWIAQYFDNNQLHLEIKWSFVWLKKHVSDHSAVNYLHQIMLLLLERQSKHSNNDTSHTLPFPLVCIDLIHEVGAENMKLLTSFAGHESLWYQRRLFSMTFLTSLFKWMQYLPNHSLNVETSQSSNDLDTSLNQLSLTLDTYSQSDEMIQELQSEDYNVNQYIESQNIFVEELRRVFSSPCSSSSSLSSQSTPQERPVSSQLIIWLQQWLCQEIKFVLAILTDEMSWNPQLQQKYGLRYLFYLHFVVIKIFTRLSTNNFIDEIKQIPLHMITLSSLGLASTTLTTPTETETETDTPPSLLLLRQVASQLQSFLNISNGMRLEL